MKALLVLSYPNISRADFEWIQAIRKKHDELYFNVVDPHFTLVFPVFDVDQETSVAHVKEQSKHIASFDFVIRCAVLSNDLFTGYTHVFLAPDEGYSKIVKLHDRLYTGLLKKNLRLDIPFIPHIGIANAVDPNVCKQLVDELNAQNFEIKGKVDALDLIWYENDQVGTIERIALS